MGRQRLFREQFDVFNPALDFDAQALQEIGATSLPFIQ